MNSSGLFFCNGTHNKPAPNELISGKTGWFERWVLQSERSGSAQVEFELNLRGNESNGKGWLVRRAGFGNSRELRSPGSGRQLRFVSPCGAVYMTANVCDSTTPLRSF